LLARRADALPRCRRYDITPAYFDFSPRHFSFRYAFTPLIFRYIRRHLLAFRYYAAR